MPIQRWHGPNSSCCGCGPGVASGAARAESRSRSGPAYRTCPATPIEAPSGARDLAHAAARVNLRSRRSFRELSAAFAEACNRAGLPADPLLCARKSPPPEIVEASDAERLSRGLQGLAVRIARGLNRMMVGPERYSRTLPPACPALAAEVARAVAYVLGNFVVHALSARRARLGDGA